MRTRETTRCGASGSPTTTVYARPPAVALLAAIYAAAAFLSRRLAVVDENVTPFWPPTGIAVAALLLFGTRWWPGIALGALVVNVPITASPIAALTTALGNTLAPILVVWILRRARFRPELDRPRDVVVLLMAVLHGGERDDRGRLARALRPGAGARVLNLVVGVVGG